MKENVQLLNVMGDDKMIVDVARVSYEKMANDYSDDKNEGLIKFLIKHNHWSPFSHPQLQFRIKMPIYVERQFVKTEVGRVYNSISGRYVDFSDSYTLIPEGEWRKQSTDSKQGSAGLLDSQDQAICNMIQNQIYKDCKNAYDRFIKMGVSKEQARTILPLNLNTTQIWTGSLLSFIRLYKQRVKDDAQKETGYVVKEMMRQLKQSGKFEVTLKHHGL